MDWKRFMDDTWKGKKYEGMIVFPMQDVMGKIVGLHGRKVKSKDFCNFVLDEAKFSGFFFGLFQSLPEIHKANRAYTCEGTFDYFALKKVLPNSISTLTAELTDPQHELLRFFADRVVTVFDSDPPGRKAAERASELEGVYTMDLGYKDPSDCLAKLGLDKFKSFVNRKVNDIPPF
jgi:DNA primase